MASAQHAVTLLAITGKEKDVTLLINKAGVQLLSRTDGKELHRFSFSVIKKWLPASMRSRNPGTEDCLDLQIQTDKGARDLRMRCQDSATVQAIITQLRDTVNEIMQGSEEGTSSRGRGDADTHHHVAGPASDVFLYGSGTQPPSTFTSPASTLRSRLSEMDADAPQMVSRAVSSTTGYMNAAFVPSIGGIGRGRIVGLGQGPFSSVLSPTSRTAHAGGEANAATPLARTPGGGQPPAPALDPIAGSPTKAHASTGREPSPGPPENDVEELRSQNQFLEGMVKRLTAEMGRLQAAADPSSQDMETAVLVDDGSPLPVWLKDRRYLNPLLSAYDERIGELEAEAADRAEALNRLQQQVDEVIAENEALRGELARGLDARGAAAAAAEGAALASADGALKLLREEADLLRQENDLLVAQQGELDAEIQRLQGQLADQAAAAVSMAQENAAMMARAQQQVSGAQAVEARHSKLQAALSAAESRVLVLEQQLAEAQAQLDDERIAAETATRALEELQGVQGKLKADAAANAQAARIAQDKQSALQAEASALRERLETVGGELSAARLEATELHNSLASVNDRLAEYQQRDADAFKRIREAAEAADVARQQRDSALSRQGDLEREVELLQQRLANLRVAVRDQAYSEVQGELHAARAELESTKAALKAADAQTLEYQAAADRAARDVATLTVELSALKEDFGDTLSSKSKVTLMTLTTMERIQEVERQRDDAAQKLETVSRQLERLQRDWSLERHTMDAELRSLRKALVDRETTATLASSEAAGLARQVEALTSELSALREARSRVEADLRQQITATRAERDLEIKAMATRLEGALAACSRSIADAERMLETKDSLLAKWKEEAGLVAAKLERALSDHRRELDLREHAVQELRSQLQGLQAAHVAAYEDAEGARAAAADMQAALADAEARSAQLHMQLLAATTREEELAQEARSLQAVLERTRYDTRRGERPPDELALKLQSLRRAGEALAGYRGVGPMTSPPAQRSLLPADSPV